MKKYVLVRAEDGTLLGGGIYAGAWGEAFIKIERSDNETIMINVSKAIALHFFEEPPEALLNYMRITNSSSVDPPAPGIVGTSSRSSRPSVDQGVQGLVDAGPPGHTSDASGVGLADLPIPKKSNRPRRKT